MPNFDPDKFLAEREIGTSPVDSPAKFDPNSFMESRGIQTLPNKGNIQDGATAAKAAQPGMAESAAQGAAQGATFGFGNQLSAAAGALAPTPTDDAMGRGYLDRYANIRDQLKSDTQQAQQAHPVISALSEIAASAPLAIATSGLGGTSTGGRLAVAGAQGAAYGAGKSEKNSVAQTATDAAKSGLLSVGLVGAVGLGKNFLNSLPESGLNSAFDETGNSLAKAVPKTFFDKNGDYIISYNKGMGDSFKVGKDMQAALSNEDVQSQISNELNSQPAQIASVIKQTRSKLSDMFDQKLAENPDATGDVSKAFQNTYDKLKGVFSEADPAVQKSKEGLESYVKGVEDSLRTKSPTGTLQQVPLSDIADAQQQLGNVVFQQKSFLRPGTNGVHGAAKSFFGDLAGAFQKADIENGTGGDLANINKVLSATYKMEGANMQGATVRGLANPQNLAAAKKYAAFVQPFAELSPEVRDALAPELHNYLTNDFQKAVTKAQVLNLVTSGGNAGHSTANTVLSLAGLKGTSKALTNEMANRLGALAGGMSSAPPSALPPSSLSNLMSSSAPAVGALSTQSQPDQNSLGALRPVQ